MNPKKWIKLSSLSKISQALDEATDTDMNIGELMTVGRKYLKITESDIYKISLDEYFEEGPTYLYNGLYVLVPKQDWQTIYQNIQNTVQ